VAFNAELSVPVSGWITSIFALLLLCLILAPIFFLP
jgi:hypothetical protein